MGNTMRFEVFDEWRIATLEPISIVTTSLSPRKYNPRIVGHRCRGNAPRPRHVTVLEFTFLEIGKACLTEFPGRERLNPRRAGRFRVDALLDTDDFRQ